MARFDVWEKVRSKVWRVVCELQDTVPPILAELGEQSVFVSAANNFYYVGRVEIIIGERIIGDLEVKKNLGVFYRSRLPLRSLFVPPFVAVVKNCKKQKNRIIPFHMLPYLVVCSYVYHKTFVPDGLIPDDELFGKIFLPHDPFVFSYYCRYEPRFSWKKNAFRLGLWGDEKTESQSIWVGYKCDEDVFLMGYQRGRKAIVIERIQSLSDFADFVKQIYMYKTINQL